MNDTGIGVFGISQYLPVLGGIGIGPILFSVIVPNTGQTTVYGTVSPPRRADCHTADREKAIDRHQGWECG